MSKDKLEIQIIRADSGERAAALVEVLKQVGPLRANELLRDYFNMCDAIGEHSKELAKQFDRAGFVTDTEKILELPCTVYRAGWEDSDPKAGLSWTTDIEIARMFAKYLFSPRAWFLGLRRTDVQSVIWGATCTKARGYITDRNESEVIPKTLKDIQVIEGYGLVKD